MTADTGSDTTDAGIVPSDVIAPEATAAIASEQAPEAVESAETTDTPESYAFDAPDGIDLDTAAVDEFSAIARELKLDQPTAQRVANVAVAMAQRQQEAHQKVVSGWVEEVKADKEIGGDNLEQNLAIARKALDYFGTPELRDLLNMTGLGNNPHVIKAFLKMGKSTSEDVFIPGSPKGQNNDPARIMFPTMN